ncbi:MAG: DUF998 domain-containing protein [Candidatus Saccharibacteria bacterium]
MPRTRQTIDIGSIVFASFAAILYSSWPLGNVLDPIANRGLASNLGALGRPYNWLFMLLDIVSGAVVLAVALRLFERKQLRRQWLINWSIIGYGLFGVLTALDAVLPLDCVEVVQQCGALTHHPLIILHGLASLGSIASLTISIVGFWYLLGFNRRISRLLRGFLLGVVLTWFGFGVTTGVLLLENRTSALAQHLFIVICSLWIAALPYVVFRARGGPDLLSEKVTVR